jgi:hypothetical protein
MECGMHGRWHAQQGCAGVWHAWTVACTTGVCGSVACMDGGMHNRGARKCGMHARWHAQQGCAGVWHACTVACTTGVCGSVACMDGGMHNRGVRECGMHYGGVLRMCLLEAWKRQALAVEAADTRGAHPRGPGALVACEALPEDESGANVQQEALARRLGHAQAHCCNAGLLPLRRCNPVPKVPLLQRPHAPRCQHRRKHGRQQSLACSRVGVPVISSAV